MKRTSLKDYLIEFMTENELEIAPRSFEIVGDIAIIEIGKEIEKHEKTIGEAILKVNSAIKVVLKKSGIHKGKFRTQNLIHIAGENRKETIYQENGIKLMINPETVYFSARLSTERENLMNNLKKNKRVLVMFSGAGPYTFVALKKQPDTAKITSIEINPEGHKYALESLYLNKNLIKKSQLYKKIITFLKENKLPIFEKKLVETLNNLKLHFINADVRVQVKKFKLKKINNEKIKNYHNEIFKQKTTDIFNFLREAKFDMIYLNLDEIEISEQTLILFILFSEKFNFTCKIKNQLYLFDEKISKSYLLNYFEHISEIENIMLYDEIYMPLPKDAELFLNCAFDVADKGAVIHMYDFVHENDFPTLSEKAIKEAAKKAKKNIQILQTRKVGQYSPGKYRVCCDFKVLN